MTKTRAGLSLTALAMAALAALGPTSAAPPAKTARPKTRNDIRYSTEVATPHVPWATRLTGGPIRGFFVPSVSQGRDMVELMQRLALEPTTVTIDPSWDVNCWGIGDFYGHEERGDKDDFRVVYGYVEEELTSPKPFEVILLPGLNGWSRLTRPSRDAILRRVKDGAGLVLIHPFVGDVKGHPFAGDEKEGDARIWDVSPLVGVPDDRVSDRGYPEPNRDAIAQGRWETVRSHFITDGVDLALIPSGAAGGRFYRYQPAGEVLVQAEGSPVVAVRTYGKGRVVGLAWVSEGFVPEPVDPYESARRLGLLGVRARAAGPRGDVGGRSRGRRADLDGEGFGRGRDARVGEPRTADGRDRGAREERLRGPRPHRARPPRSRPRRVDAEDPFRRARP